MTPEIVCLCGSTRFMDAFEEANRILTLHGKIVLSIGVNTKSDKDSDLSPLQKAALDVLHKEKINLASSILILNVRGYIGDSTWSEIYHAMSNNKPIAFWTRANAPAGL